MINLKNLPLVNEETYFVYDLDKVSENVAILRKLFQNLDQIFFSVKSNPSSILLRHLSGLGINFDVSSENELQKAYGVTSDYQRITVSGPAKTDQFFTKIKKINLKSVHLDSLEEYNLLKAANVPMSVRWPLESTYSQKVGLPMENLLSIVEECRQGTKLSGIHIYIGRERATAELVVSASKVIKDFLTKNHQAFIPDPCIFWGAGLPLPHHIETSFFPSDLGVRTHLECGRALIHNAGFYITQVLEAREKAGEKFLIINGGLQHLATHFGSPRFGQTDVIIKQMPVRNERLVSYSIFGSLGIASDLLVKGVLLNDSIQRGDWIALGPAGAYGLTAGSNQFIGPQFAKEIFLIEGKILRLKANQPSYLESGLHEYKNS